MAPREPLDLSATTGNAAADAVLRALVTACEAAFPGRVRSYLLAGSYAAGGVIPQSDLDVLIVFRNAMTDSERQRLFSLTGAIERLSAIRVDVDPLDDDYFLRRVSAGDLAAIPIYGEDLRGQATLEPLEYALARYLRLATHYIWQLRGMRAGLAWPLGYPVSDGEFYGYERFGLFQGDSAAEMYTPGCRTIVNAASSIATAYLSHLGQRVTSKRHSVELYAEHVPGDSATWLAHLYDACKARWQYHIPDDPSERAELRALCQRMLTFENDFLAFARPLTEAALAGPHDEYGWPRALDRLRWIAYPDLTAPPEGA